MKRIPVTPKAVIVGALKGQTLILPAEQGYMPQKQVLEIRDH